MKSRTVRPLSITSVLLLVSLAGSTTALAGTPDDPEVVDPEGDVHLEGLAPLPAGAEWADILAVWYEEPEPGAVVMRIQLLEAEAVPPSGEVAAHLKIHDDHFVVGFTTVLPPFATPIYQGGFYCLSDAERNVDPADCHVIADVVLAANVLRVPLPATTLGVGPGDTIETLTAYSGAWYLNVQTVLDDTPPGRPYQSLANDTAAPPAATDPAAPPAVSGAAGSPDDPPRTEEAPGALPLLFGALAALLALLALRRAPRRRPPE